MQQIKCVSLSLCAPYMVRGAVEHRAENWNWHDALGGCFRIGFFQKLVPAFRSKAVNTAFFYRI